MREPTLFAHLPKLVQEANFHIFLSAMSLISPVATLVQVECLNLMHSV